MGKVISFSDFSKISLPENSGCFVDTNFIIALNNEEEEFYTASDKLFTQLEKSQTSLFITHTIRAEFLDYQRRYLLTKKLKEVQDGTGKWHQRASAYFKRLAREKLSEFPEKELLNDSQIKHIRKKIHPFNQGMEKGWIYFCQHFLGHGIDKAWEAVEEYVNYLDLRTEEEKKEPSYVIKKIEWPDMVKLMGQTGIGAHDAMILNAFNCSVFEYIISTDLDVAYSVKQNSVKKTAVIPDRLLSDHRYLLEGILT